LYRSRARRFLASGQHDIEEQHNVDDGTYA